MDTTRTQVQRIIELGEVIARQGISSAGVDLLLLAHDARDAGVSPVLIDVLIDEQAPEVARARAFVLVGLRLSVMAAGEGSALESSSVEGSTTERVELSFPVPSAR